jgi:hypothetical protein
MVISHSGLYVYQRVATTWINVLIRPPALATSTPMSGGHVFDTRKQISSGQSNGKGFGTKQVKYDALWLVVCTICCGSLFIKWVRMGMKLEAGITYFRNYVMFQCQP